MIYVGLFVGLTCVTQCKDCLYSYSITYVSHQWESNGENCVAVRPIDLKPPAQMYRQPRVKTDTVRHTCLQPALAILIRQQLANEPW